MKTRIATIVSLCLAIQFAVHGQTLETSSARYNDTNYALYLDSQAYSVTPLDTSVFSVTYDLAIMVDTLKRETFNSMYILLVGSHVNKFLPFAKFTYDRYTRKSPYNFGGDMIHNQHHVFYYEAIYQDRRTGMTTITERLCEDDFITTEDTPVQEWTITSHRKDIGEYECNLAECDFRGRHYYAWYAEDIPMPYGPWKLGGLPGLIVSAYDSDHQYEYSMVSIEQSLWPIFRTDYNYIEADRRRLNRQVNEILHKPLVYMDKHFHLTTRRVDPGSLFKERDLVYQYDAIEKD